MGALVWLYKLHNDDWKFVLLTSCSTTRTHLGLR